MRAEEAEKLRITPIVETSTVDIDIRRSNLDKCEKHIADVVRAAKSKFSGIERTAAATPSNSSPSTMTSAQFNKSLREMFSESDLKDFCLALSSTLYIQVE